MDVEIARGIDIILDKSNGMFIDIRKIKQQRTHTVAESIQSHEIAI